MAANTPTLNPVRAGVRFARQQWRIIAEPYAEKKRFTAFEQDRAERRHRRQDLTINAAKWAQAVEDLNRDGFARIPGAMNADLLTRLGAEIEAKLDAGADLGKVTRDTVRAEGDLSAARDILTDEEVVKGQSFFNRLTNYASAKEPLLNCPAAVPLTFDETLIDIAGAYMDCFPAVGGLNLRKSFVNDLPSFDTQFFHFDQNSPRFVKFFMYLNDVDMDGGPFCYVEGSHTKRFRGHSKKHRWTTDEIESAYGKDSIVYLTSQMGDLLMADTSGCHRGTKPTKNDRKMLTVNYVVHPEFDGRQTPFQLRRADFERLTPKQQAAADFLDIVD